MGAAYARRSERTSEVLLRAERHPGHIHRALPGRRRRLRTLAVHALPGPGPFLLLPPHHSLFPDLPARTQAASQNRLHRAQRCRRTRGQRRAGAHPAPAQRIHPLPLVLHQVAARVVEHRGQPRHALQDRRHGVAQPQLRGAPDLAGEGEARLGRAQAPLPRVLVPPGEQGQDRQGRRSEWRGRTGEGCERPAIIDDRGDDDDDDDGAGETQAARMRAARRGTVRAHRGARREGPEGAEPGGRGEAFRRDARARGHHAALRAAHHRAAVRGRGGRGQGTGEGGEDRCSATAATTARTAAGTSTSEAAAASAPIPPRQLGPAARLREHRNSSAQTVLPHAALRLSPAALAHPAGRRLPAHALPVHATDALAARTPQALRLVLPAAPPAHAPPRRLAALHPHLLYAERRPARAAVALADDGDVGRGDGELRGVGAAVRASALASADPGAGPGADAGVGLLRLRRQPGDLVRRRAGLVAEHGDGQRVRVWLPEYAELGTSVLRKFNLYFPLKRTQLN